MRALIVLAGVALAVPVASCNTASWQTDPTVSPAPLQKTVIDDRAVRYGFLSLDALATLADAALDAKLITPGTAKAKAIASGLDSARHALNAASAAQKAGSVNDYNSAFDQAMKAMASVKLALGR